VTEIILGEPQSWGKVNKPLEGGRGSVERSRDVVSSECESWGRKGSLPKGGIPEDGKMTQPKNKPEGPGPIGGCAGTDRRGPVRSWAEGEQKRLQRCEEGPTWKSRPEEIQDSMSGKT